MLASNLKYSRRLPPTRILRDQDSPLIFQLVDLDYVQAENGVRVRLFGTTREGNSVCCSTATYVPYFYVKAPLNYKNADQLIQYEKALNIKLLKPENLSRHMIPAHVIKIVTKIEEVRGASLMNYTDDMNQLFLKVSVISPRLITQCRNTFCEVAREPCQYFESNIDFELRFMTDLNLLGCCWVEVPATKYSVQSKNKETLCQIEVMTSVDSLKVHHPNEEPYGDIAPLRMLSFDIECECDPGVFPTPNKNPIIQIACIGKELGSSVLNYKVCFVLNTCALVDGADIVECPDEATLLKRWAAFIRETDPDILTGYNIQNFDLSYIFDRSKHLKIDREVLRINRLTDSLCRMRSSTFSSAQLGTRTTKLFDIDGRIVFDVFQIVQRDYKLRSYSLNNVSYHFLNEQKEDVEPNIIATLQNGNDQDRRRLAIYCLKDAELPLKLLEKLMLVINYIEMARVTGVPINFLMTRGQQVRILSQLLRKAKTTGYFLPVIERAEVGEGGYEGATVIEPIRGFYNQPIATLDFASLYPSIMIAHNICYSTHVRYPPANFVENKDYIKTPSDNYFVTLERKRGILPSILEDLLAARKKAKLDLKNATDPLKKMVLNGRQLAIKISANSVYGFTGATVGKLPCLEISQSVTAFGRQMIDTTKNLVELSLFNHMLDFAAESRHVNRGTLVLTLNIDRISETYRSGQHGMTKNAVVIYGDTDSVMVDFGVQDIAEAMKFGSHAATLISQSFKAPIKLEFEKVYCPYLLIQKKRYAGLYFTRPEKHDKIDTKGLETVRRDNCPLVGNVMTTCLELMLIHRNPEEAIAYAKRVISDLLRNKIDISMLIISKELTKANDDYQGKQAHAVLAERMSKRDPGSAPKLGDRVPYVIVAKGSKTPAFEKAEDPLYVLKNKIPIDTNYYLQNQLLKPLVRLFDPLTNNQAESMLTQGEHARVRAQAVSKTSGIGMFAVKRATCMLCKCVLKDDNSAPICSNCEPKFTTIYVEKMEELRMAQHRFARLWTQCQNCVEDMSNEINCAAIDCPIFYMREKARVDFEEKTTVIRRFKYYKNCQTPSCPK